MRKINKLVGGTETDSFVLSAATLSGSINGGTTGLNTLTGHHAAATWTLTGTDAGTVTGVGGNFTNINNLVRGTGTFPTRRSSDLLSGSINGGTTGLNTLTANNNASTWTLTGT